MNCMHCGKEITDNSTFCSVCGAKQTRIYREEFTRGRQSERVFLEKINAWFQQHPKATNIRVYFTTGTAFGLLVNRTCLKNFVIEYELSGEEDSYEYALVRKVKVGLLPRKIKKYVARWEKKNPQMEVLNWSGGTNARGQVAAIMLGGIGAVNKLTVFMLVRSHCDRLQEMPFVAAA